MIKYFIILLVTILLISLYVISKRITRSYTEIREFVCTIDEISLKKKKSIDLKIIKEILED